MDTQDKRQPRPPSRAAVFILTQIIWTAFSNGGSNTLVIDGIERETGLKHLEIVRALDAIGARRSELDDNEAALFQYAFTKDRLRLTLNTESPYYQDFVNGRFDGGSKLNLSFYKGRNTTGASMPLVVKPSVEPQQLPAADIYNPSTEFVAAPPRENKGFTRPEFMQRLTYVYGQLFPFAPSPEPKSVAMALAKIRAKTPEDLERVLNATTAYVYSKGISTSTPHLFASVARMPEVMQRAENLDAMRQKVGQYWGRNAQGASREMIAAALCMSGMQPSDVQGFVKHYNSKTPMSSKLPIAVKTLNYWIVSYAQERTLKQKREENGNSDAEEMVSYERIENVLGRYIDQVDGSLQTD